MSNSNMEIDLFDNGNMAVITLKCGITYIGTYNRNHQLDRGDLYSSPDFNCDTMIYRGHFKNIFNNGKIIFQGLGIQYFNHYFYEGFFKNGYFYGVGTLYELESRKVLYDGNFA